MDVAAEVDPSESLFAQRAEELFEQISNENAVSSESASLVVALAYLDLEVTEEEVVEATRGILKPPEIQFSKDVFFKFVELLRRQTSATGYVSLPECAENVSAAPAIPTHALCSYSEVRADVAVSGPDATGLGAEDTSVEASGHGVWIFEPRVCIQTFPADSRVLAEHMYARVDQDMVPEIDQAVNANFETFLLNLPQTLSEEVQRELRESWLQEHYVKYVESVVERRAKARWSFQADLALDLVPDEERSRAAKLYELIDEALAEKIDTAIACEYSKVASTFPGSVSSQLHDMLRMSWLKSNYIKVVARVLEERDLGHGAVRSVAPTWTFTPEVSVETLPVCERLAAATLYASVDASAATEIGAAVDNAFSSFAALLPASTPSNVRAEIRRSWLVEKYVNVVSQVVNARTQTSADGDSWTFQPAVSIESLPCAERVRAATVFSVVTRETEADILRVTEDRWSSYQAILGFVMCIELAANLKKEWLIREYVDIVSSVTSSAPTSSAVSGCVAHSSVLHTRGPRSPDAASLACSSADSSSPRKKTSASR